MPLFAPHVITPDSALGGKVIEKSLRFNRGDAPYLQATLGNGDEDKWTWSGWVKKTVNGQHQNLFSSGSDVVYTHINFDNSDRIRFQNWHSAQKGTKITTRLLRDNTAWMHIVVIWDSGNSTADDRMRIYVNGTRETSFSSSTNPDQNQDSVINGNSLGGSDYGEGKHFIGKFADTSDNSGTYKTEIHFIDGYAYDPSYFGFTDSQTGIWMPKRYEGVYGSNGFHLDFSDNSSTAALGIDKSGNGNNFTPNNFSVSAGSGNDSSEDTPSNNFCTLNPRNLGSGTLINGNLETSPLNAGYAVRGTNFVSSGKWYFEFVVTAGTNMPTYAMVGIQRDSGSVGSYSGTINIPDGYGLLLFGSTSYLYNGTTATAYNIGATSFNDVIGVAFDLDKGEIYFYRDGSLLGGGAPAYSNITQGNYAPHVSNQTTSNNDMACFVNFGQRPFAHTPPTGYRALNSRNLATPTASEIVRAQRHFDTLLWDGNSTNNRKITGLEFQPDLCWIKARTVSVMSHYFISSIQTYTSSGSGNGNVGAFESGTNDSAGEATTPDGGFVSFNSDGFTLGKGSNDNNADSAYQRMNASGRTYVAWCWKAGGGSNTFNVDGTGYATASAAGITDGSIALTGASVNREAGFSMVTYTGTGSTGTVGHGFTKTPKVVMTKSRSAAGSWNYLDVVGNSTAEYGLFLNDNGGYTSYQGGTYWADTLPTSSVFTVNSNASTNASGVTYIAYCWTDIPGYSKMGKYTGNGSSNGPFIHLGFRPAWFMQKKVSGSGNWYIFDNKRSGFNVDNDMLSPNLTDAEYDGQTYPRLDFVSNGIKWVDAGSSVHNASGATYIYMAFAERPSGTIFGIDANAR